MTDDTTASSFDAAATLREPVRRRLYDHVACQPAPVSRDEAARALGLGRAAVAFHLDRLVAVGLLEVEYRRMTARTGPGAGRPAKLYRASDRTFAVTLPHRELPLLAELLAAGASGNALGHRGARARGRLLGRQATATLPEQATSAERRGALESTLRALGFVPYRQEDTLWARSCPFDPVSRRYPPLVCGLAQALVEGIIAGLHTGGSVIRSPWPGHCCIRVTAGRT
jgi:predicted ArsR family transcriptional regulator